MYELNAYIGDPNINPAKIRQLEIKRDWMSTGTYHCYPVTFANTVGYGIYFEEDISFSWDGDIKKPALATKGFEHIWSGRPEGTVSFDTNLIFQSDENTSLLTMPVPNQFIKNVSVVGSVLSTSFFTGTFPVVWKIESAGEYFVPAGTNIACILPISIKKLNDSNINYLNKVFPSYRVHNDLEYVDAIHNYVDENGQQPKLYKKGLDHKGNKIGKHEIERLNMKVSYK